MEMKGVPIEGDPWGGRGDLGTHTRRKANVVARARLRGEAALRRHSGNFRNPHGWVCAGSLTGDLGRSSPESGRGMTSPDQALIGHRAWQVGAAWPRRPQPARWSLGGTDPHVPLSRRWVPHGNGAAAGRPYVQGDVGKSVQRCVHTRVPRGGALLWAVGSGARGPRRGRSAGAAKRRACVLARGGEGALRGAGARAHSHKAAGGPAAPRPRPSPSPPPPAAESPGSRGLARKAGSTQY